MSEVDFSIDVDDLSSVQSSGRGKKRVIHEQYRLDGKFWNITYHTIGRHYRYTTEWGKIGGSSRKTTKHGTINEIHNLINKKISKGYTLVNGEISPSVVSSNRRRNNTTRSYNDLKTKIKNDARVSRRDYSSIKRHMDGGLFFKKGFEVMKYGELRPRDIQNNPSKLEKYVGWFISEKIDGWQAIWDGKGTMYTKKFHKTFKLPGEWLALLPPIPLIGEIKIGNLPATKTSSLTSKKAYDSELWRKTKFWVFDFGSKYHSQAPFHERYQLLNDLVKIVCRKVKDCPVRVLKQTRASSIHTIMAKWDKIIKDSGEGIILTKPDSVYVEKNSRSPHRVKLKSRNDMEGRVIGFNKETSGDRKGWLKSLRVRLSSGAEFNLGIGFTNEQRKHYNQYFKKKTLVSFSYRGLSENGKPKEARFVRVRKDI